MKTPFPKDITSHINDTTPINAVYNPELKELNINIDNIYKTKDLTKIEDINYKFTKYIRYPERDNTKDWTENLTDLITNILKNGVTYSISVHGYNTDGRNIVTFGPHILITNKINLESLITYINGHMDSSVLQIDSDFDLSDDCVIFFQYREVSIIKSIHDIVSDIDYTKDLNEKDNKKDNKIDLDRNDKIYTFVKSIPISSDFAKYSYIINTNHINSSGLRGTLYKYTHIINIFIYQKSDKSYKGIVYKNDKLYYEFTDIINNKDYDLIRKINNNLIYIKDGKISHIESELKSKLIKTQSRDTKYDDKIGSFDIECYLDGKDKFVSYSCKWKTDKNSKEYYLTDYKNYEEMFEQCFKDMFENCNGYTMYAHNLSSFDGILILKTIYKNFKVRSRFKDNKLMTFILSKIVKVNGKKKTQRFNFNCSLKLLPLSLEKLIKSLNIDTQKLSFPYKFVNKDNLDYIGPIPSYEFYDDSGVLDSVKHEKYLQLYKEYENKPWNLRIETMKYLHNDVEALYKILIKYSKEFYDLESINITNSISISSLALKTFLTNYYDEDRTPIKIPRLKQYSNIRQAYYGGRVEVFSSYVENAHWYDVNSLYPTVMLQDMPIGDIIKSTDPNLDNYFGFCNATVNVPNNTYNPVLPFRDDKWNIYNPTGKWTGWYSSEILKYARDNQNVIVIVHYGYKYETGKDVFTKYINYFFNLKREADKMKDDVKRILAKLKLNSLYGRFGLKYTKINTEIVTSDRAKELTLKYNILDNVKLDEENNLEFIRYNVEPSDYLFYQDENLYHEINAIGQKESDNIIRSVGISSMITSYAMMFMHPFLNLPDNKCHYTDTDSTFLQKPLDPKYVGDGLGQFKYEGLVKRAYFISPKLYCLVMEDGRIIIKSKGVPSKYLTELGFINFLNGISKSVKLKRFKNASII
jgi:hypothetical protein